MKLAVSNIAWKEQHDEAVYALMRHYGFTGLEIAPTRFFPEVPYSHLIPMQKLAARLREHGFTLPSMQSLLAGHPELRLFEGTEKREALFAYLKQAVLFAEAGGIRNLVFGSPKNRISHDEKDWETAIDFFTKLAHFASAHGCVIGMEPNPGIYGGNFVTSIKEAIHLCQAIAHSGFKLNLDMGCVIANGELLSLVADKVHMISHVHLSEPMLAPLTPRKRLLTDLKRILEDGGYEHFVSIEMSCPAKGDPIQNMENSLSLVAGIWNQTP